MEKKKDAEWKDAGGLIQQTLMHMAILGVTN